MLLALSLLVAPGLAAASALPQRAQQPNFASFDLLDVPAPFYEYTVFAPVPVQCAAFSAEVSDPAQADASKECPTHVIPLSVTFTDCGTPFTMCYCVSANISTEEAVDHLARIPVGLRRQMDVVMVMPAPYETSYAYTVGGSVHIFGVCSQKSWIHESVHTSDHGQSESAQWGNAIASDSCVPDEYSQTNLREDYAQAGVLQVYRRLHGTLPPGFSEDCMSNQFAYLDSLPLYDPSTLLGETCDIAGSFEMFALHTAAPSASITDQIITGSYTNEGNDHEALTTAAFVDGMPPDAGRTPTVRLTITGEASATVAASGGPSRCSLDSMLLRLASAIAVLVVVFWF